MQTDITKTSLFKDKICQWLRKTKEIIFNQTLYVGVSFTVAKMFPWISTSDLFAMKSFVESDWLQIELGVALLQLLHAVLNKTGWENKNKLGKYLICLLDPLKTLLGEVPLAAWVWAPGLQASNVIRALDANLFIESWKVTVSKLWCEDKTVFMLISENKFRYVLHTCSRSSHSWPADWPLTMSRNAGAGLQFEVVILTPRFFVSSLRTVQRNRRAAVWSCKFALFWFKHTDNVSADGYRKENDTSSISLINRQCKSVVQALWQSEISPWLKSQCSHTTPDKRDKYACREAHPLVESADFPVALLITAGNV